MRDRGEMALLAHLLQRVVGGQEHLLSCDRIALPHQDEGMPERPDPDPRVQLVRYLVRAFDSVGGLRYPPQHGFERS